MYVLLRVCLGVGGGEVFAVVLLSLVGVLDDGSDSGSSDNLSRTAVPVDSLASWADSADVDPV